MATRKTPAETPETPARAYNKVTYSGVEPVAVDLDTVSVTPITRQKASIYDVPAINNLVADAADGQKRAVAIHENDVAFFTNGIRKKARDAGYGARVRVGKNDAGQTVLVFYWGPAIKRPRKNTPGDDN